MSTRFVIDPPDAFASRREWLEFQQRMQALAKDNADDPGVRAGLAQARAALKELPAED